MTDKLEKDTQQLLDVFSDPTTGFVKYVCGKNPSACEKITAIVNTNMTSPNGSLPQLSISPLSKTETLQSSDGDMTPTASQFFEEDMTPTASKSSDGEMTPTALKSSDEDMTPTDSRQNNRKMMEEALKKRARSLNGFDDEDDEEVIPNANTGTGWKQAIAKGLGVAGTLGVAVLAKKSMQPSAVTAVAQLGTNTSVASWVPDSALNSLNLPNFNTTSQLPFVESLGFANTTNTNSWIPSNNSTSSVKPVIYNQNSNTSVEPVQTTWGQPPADIPRFTTVPVSATLTVPSKAPSTTATTPSNPPVPLPVPVPVPATASATSPSVTITETGIPSLPVAITETDTPLLPVTTETSIPVPPVTITETGIPVPPVTITETGIPVPPVTITETSIPAPPPAPPVIQFTTAPATKTEPSLTETSIPVPPVMQFITAPSTVTSDVLPIVSTTTSNPPLPLPLPSPSSPKNMVGEEVLSVESPDSTSLGAQLDTIDDDDDGDDDDDDDELSPVTPTVDSSFTELLQKEYAAITDSELEEAPTGELSLPSFWLESLPALGATFQPQPVQSNSSIPYQLTSLTPSIIKNAFLTGTSVDISNLSSLIQDVKPMLNKAYVDMTYAITTLPSYAINYIPLPYDNLGSYIDTLRDNIDFEGFKPNVSGYSVEVLYFIAYLVLLSGLFPVINKIGSSKKPYFLAQDLKTQRIYQLKLSGDDSILTLNDITPKMRRLQETKFLFQ